MQQYTRKYNDSIFMRILVIIAISMLNNIFYRMIMKSLADVGLRGFFC